MEIVDTGSELVKKREVKELRFFALNNLPDNRMDKDLIEAYIKYKNNLL